MKKVLLVYDQQISAQSHCRSLYYKGIYPLVSNDVQEAYELACYNRFDLIIVDFLDDLDKIQETLTKLANVKRSAKIIVTTSAHSLDLSEHLRALGADQVLLQSSHPREFLDSLSSDLEVCPHTTWVSGEFCWN
ncbi:response regulator [Pseudobacteriovorax antillogorgiicola]|uniref:Response regulator receiver domain-containing protein n=1 Tax=Pseudobacteriovorax antillogorgiicola TaxID=1513793 RepID=A0A1Y6BZ28_9BACT|nr:response regulator [Pseudobacteriovorax antillogorgiicola]TCS51232.1 response regulator receiver domain-containing protein [Pseudobacteriovorax antillogorgiicola]SMF36855.1 Response regulator receiver domain-containing protein [Pseudobacteriovorax antillogorgiicola]